MSDACLSRDDLQTRIERFPRQRLAVLPTGLQEVPRLASVAGAARLFLKRDDLTGLALGGNKSRGMEFILGEALQTGCDVLVAGGGVDQSNHAVQCAAAANKAGIESVTVLRERESPRGSGNVLLHELLGGRTVWVRSDPEIRDRRSIVGRMHEVAAELRAAGRRPYVLESSLHPLTVVSYVNAVLEMDLQLPPSTQTRVYITSEGAGLGGLALGIKLLGLPWSVVGLDWRPREEGAEERVIAAIDAAASLLGVSNPVKAEDIDIRDAGGPSYSVADASTWAAVAQAARLEGLLVDPVYSGKGLAGLLADLKQAPLPPGGQAVFVHTGGVAALFAYEAEIRQHVLT